jgi:TolB protein
VVRAGCVAAALFAAFATGCGGHGRTGGTIVFESDRSGREAVYAVRADGSGLTKLLDLPEEAEVIWTRDGTKALVLSYPPYLFTPAGHARRTIRLPELASDNVPSWSPDGKRLAFVTDDGDVVALNLESGVRHRITEGSNGLAVAWSPDGKRVLFIGDSNDALYTAPVGGGKRMRLLRLPGDVYPGALLQWSADGKWISLFDADYFPAKLYVVRADGTGLRLIALNARDAAWSPRGEQIAFVDHKGVAAVDVAHARRRQLTRMATTHHGNTSIAWSPDGQHLVYPRNALGRGDFHNQLWTVDLNGSDQRPVTHAFPDDGSDDPDGWVTGTVNGTQAPKLPLVALGAIRTIATSLPIVALAAAGNRAAAAQGLGGPRDFRAPLGRIVVWNPVRSSASQISIPGCGSAYEVHLAGIFFTTGGVGYRCEDPAISYGEDDTLRLVQRGRGAVEIVHTQDGEFSGAFLDGLAEDGHEIAFDVGILGGHGDVYQARSRVWKASGVRTATVGTFRGKATVVSLNAGRIAVLRDGHTVTVLLPGGAVPTFAFGRVLGAALDGPRLVVLQSARLDVVDLDSGRRIASWAVRRGFGPAPELEGAHGNLAAYVIGTAVHVVRVSDGHEIVIDTANATGPVFARFVPSGLFYSFNESYAKRPGRLVFVAHSELEHALASRAPGR